MQRGISRITQQTGKCPVIRCWNWTDWLEKNGLITDRAFEKDLKIEDIGDKILEMLISSCQSGNENDHTHMNVKIQKVSKILI